MAMGTGTRGSASSRSPLPGMEEAEEGAGLHHGCLESLTPSALPPMLTVDFSSQVPGQEVGMGYRPVGVAEDAGQGQCRLLWVSGT